MVGCHSDCQSNLIKPQPQVSDESHCCRFSHEYLRLCRRGTLLFTLLYDSSPCGLPSLLYNCCVFSSVVLYSDLGLILALFWVFFTAFISVCDLALRQHVFCFVTTGAHLRRAQQRLKGALVLDDEGIANLTSGEPVGQLCELQTGLQWPSWIISENRQRVDAVAEASVERSGARALLRVQTGARVTAPAVRPGPRRILLGVPSALRDKCQRSTQSHANTHTLPRATIAGINFIFFNVWE